MSKTMCLLLLGLTFLQAPIRGEVGSFTECARFFYGNLPPVISSDLQSNDHAKICQRYKNTYHFASLYHRRWRTPLYSAYLLTLSNNGIKVEGEWKYEPQLPNSKANPEMTPFPVSEVDQNIQESQAVLEDYRGSTYERGHLSPKSHHAQAVTKEATFTLTNIVPQKDGSNSGPWNKLEDSVKRHLKEYCTGSAYIVTGVLPYTGDQQHRMKGRVSVPEYLWSAYCCPSFRRKLPSDLREQFPTYAAIGRNDPRSDETIVNIDPKTKESMKGYDVKRMSLQDLQMHLQQRLGATMVNLFNNSCPFTSQT